MPGEQDSTTYAAVSEGGTSVGDGGVYDPDYAGISTDTASDTYARVKDGAVVQRSDSGEGLETYVLIEINLI